MKQKSILIIVILVGLIVFWLAGRDLRHEQGRIIGAARRIFMVAADKKPVAVASSLKTNYDLRILDREIHYPFGPQSAVRPIPMPETALLPSLPPLPKTISSPYPWESIENVYLNNARHLSAGKYQEPDKPWILQLGELCPGVTDTPTSGHYKIWYRVSRDGGKTSGELKPLVQQGKPYNPVHPLDGIWADKNPACTSAFGPIVRATNGEIMVPITSSVLGKDGLPENPLNAFFFSYAGVLIGRWVEDGSDLTWNYSRVGIDARLSTRGLYEPTIVELKRKGEFMMVARGSNDRGIYKYEAFPGGRFKYTCTGVRDLKSRVAGRKWISFSKDYCRTWSEPKHLTYSDGTEFFSPSACSTLIRSRKNDRIYWIGNICPENPDGNNPRYPLIIGKIDEKSCGLIKASVLVLDTLNPEHDTPRMELSNFLVYEDPQTGNICVELYRLDYTQAEAYTESWQKLARCWYLIGVPAS
ncbi:MAG: sialidase family protein [Kiritimatiellaeota bacterium]|nr:sialidase family protein [Kiritimatiellota bacterium]